MHTTQSSGRGTGGLIDATLHTARKRGGVKRERKKNTTLYATLAKLHHLGGTRTSLPRSLCLSASSVRFRRCAALPASRSRRRAAQVAPPAVRRGNCAPAQAARAAARSHAGHTNGRARGHPDISLGCTAAVLPATLSLSAPVHQGCLMRTEMSRFPRPVFKLPCFCAIL